MMKQFIITAIILTLSHISGFSQTAQPLFELPTPPEKMDNFYDRCNFSVEHYWDKCNWKQAIKDTEGLETAFENWVQLLPHAAADTVRLSANRVITANAKNPKALLQVANLAEKYMYSDAGDYIIEEVYLLFADAVASNKKIKPADKARFAADAKRIKSSAVGNIAPDLTLYLADGTKTSLHNIKGKEHILFFNDPDCGDCNIARIRLSTDQSVKALIDAKRMTLISIYPGEPSDDWMIEVRDYPENWIVAAAPDADDYFKLDKMPAIYNLEKDYKIKLKDVRADVLVNALRALVDRTK
ncbi:MAG: DUF5106 domain-containing protein [Muribaculaceae bacterium]|nr:DUF5106 domain-containing protein [Muribaculaceae bacterium]